MPDSSPQGLLLQSMGAGGSDYLTGTNPLTGEYFGIQALEDCTIGGLTVGNASDISGAIIPQGATLFGQFQVVQIVGKAVLYKY